MDNFNQKGKQTMKEIITLIAMAFVIVALSGCGHNVINYGDGVGFDAGINPENGTFSFNLRYGKILSAVTRDNVEIEMNGAVAANGGIKPSVKGTTAAEGQNATPGTAGNGNVGINTEGALRIKIGRQINGYAVDLVEAGADPDKVIKALGAEEK